MIGTESKIEMVREFKKPSLITRNKCRKYGCRNVNTKKRRSAFSGWWNQPFPIISKREAYFKIILGVEQFGFGCQGANFSWDVRAFKFCFTLTFCLKKKNSFSRLSLGKWYNEKVILLSWSVTFKKRLWFLQIPNLLTTSMSQLAHHHNHRHFQLIQVLKIQKENKNKVDEFFVWIKILPRRETFGKNQMTVKLFGLFQSKEFPVNPNQWCN